MWQEWRVRRLKTDVCAVVMIAAEFFFEWEVFQTNDVEKLRTHILCSVTPPSENHAICEVMWENMVEPDMPPMAI